MLRLPKSTISIMGLLGPVIFTKSTGIPNKISSWVNIAQVCLKTQFVLVTHFCFMFDLNTQTGILCSLLLYYLLTS